ncbi:nucleotidyltransferase domain-containing protein [Leptolyngbya sp. AN03gr2]|uniref:nucleotidyltransferase domain-containing protein n=1 Tax=unclassified Leptolyngbya TaxID=2650499 RepID=UPI003D31FEC3
MSNQPYTLVYFTEHPKINQIIQGVIGVFEKAFLGRIRGYYLQGSFASQSAVTNSDLDLYVIFKERFDSQVEAMTAMALCQSCAQISPVLLEIKPGPELALHQAENAGIALNFKYSTQFLYGEDIRDRIPTPTSDEWVRWVMKAPQTALRVTRSAEVLIFPLSQPDDQAEFYGYDRQTIPGSDWIDRPSSKWLITTVGWIATALVQESGNNSSVLGAGFNFPVA